MAEAYTYSRRFCPVIRTGSIMQPRVRFLQRCCPSPVYSMTVPTVDLAGIVRFTSSYPMFGTDMYEFTMTNNQPANLVTTIQKFYKNSTDTGYDTGVLAYPNIPFYITVTPYQDSIPRGSYTIPFTTLVPTSPLLVTVTQTAPLTVLVRWIVPESDQYVSTITSYTVRYNLINSAVVTTNSATITVLAGGTFNFQVCATNMAGSGPYSNGVSINITA